MDVAVPEPPAALLWKVNPLLPWHGHVARWPLPVTGMGKPPQKFSPPSRQAAKAAKAAKAAMGRRGRGDFDWDPK